MKLNTVYLEENLSVLKNEICSECGQKEAMESYFIHLKNL